MISRIEFNELKKKIELQEKQINNLQQKIRNLESRNVIYGGNGVAR